MIDRQSFRSKQEHRHQGVAAIEFAIVLTFLVMLLLGIFNFGLAIHRYDSLVKATRTGVRYLSSQSDPTSRAQTMRNMIRCGTATPVADTPCNQIPDLTDKMISVVTVLKTNSNLVNNFITTDLITVSITGYPFTFSIPFVSIGRISFGEIRATMVGV